MQSHASRGAFRSRRASRIVALALAGVAAGSASVAGADGVSLVGVDQVTLEWTPASGPVDGYLVLAARNGGALLPTTLVVAPRATLDVQAGEEIVVAVRAFGPGPDGTTVLGPRSESSDPVRVEAAPERAPDGLWTLRCGSCEALGFQAFSETGPVVDWQPLSEPWVFVGYARLRGAAPRAIVWEPVQELLVVWALETDPATIAYGRAPGRRPVGPADLDGDGTDEIVLRDVATGGVEIWRTDAGTPLPLAASLPGWTDGLLSSGDLDGDGRDELVWHFPESGTVGFWKLDGRTIVQGAVLGRAPSDATLARAADFDGDGREDLLWRAPDGGLAVWYLGAAGLLRVANLPRETGDERRRVVGAADYDGWPGAEIAIQDVATGAVDVVLPGSGDGAERVLALTPGSQWTVVDMAD